MATLGHLGLSYVQPDKFLRTSFYFTRPPAGRMEMDYYYIKIFLSPILGFSIAVIVMKCCCKRLCFRHSSTTEVERHNTPIYIIPVDVNDNSDIASLSSVSEFEPPAYDSITPVIPPPAYSERKISIPDEEPPAYAEIMEAPSFTSVLPPETQQT